MAVYLSLFAGAGAQFFTDAGVPLTGGLLYTYAAGTTTPLATYTSASGATPHTNPIVLNAAGRVPAEIWLTGGSSYKFILQTSTGVLIGTWDNVSTAADITALAAPNGSSLVTFLQAGANAVARSVQSKLREWVSVTDYGAVADSVTDNLAAFNAAITYASIVGKPVYVPPSLEDYILTSGITIDLSKTALISEGAILNFGQMSSGKAITFTATEAYPAFYVQTKWSGGFTVKGGNWANSTGIYIVGPVSTQFMSQAVFRDISVYRFEKNYEYGSYQWRNRFEHCTSQEPTLYHIYYPSGTINSGEVESWADCMFANGTGSKIYIRDAQFFFTDCSFLNCGLDLAGDNHTIIQGGNMEAPGYTGTGYRYITLSNYAYCELKGTQITLWTPATLITQCLFQNDVTEGGGLVFDGCRIPQPAYLMPQIVDPQRTFVAGDGRTQLKGAHWYNSFGAADYFPIATSCNTIYNGNAETNTTDGWVTTAVSGSGTFTVGSGYKKNGSYGFQINTTNLFDVFEVSQVFNVVPGRIVAVSLWHKNTTVKQSSIRLEGYTVNGSQTFYASTNLSGTNAWYNDSGTITRIVPPGTVTCKLIIQSYDQSNTYLDDIVVNLI